MKSDPKFRLIILGAGFSKPAGLPLASELFPLIRREAEGIGLSHILQADIESYLRLQSAIEGKTIAAEQIDLESFISYLDIEHFLLLPGKDTWSSEGNKSQILIRNLICKILFNRQTHISKETWSLYETFASFLRPDDIVITFNYDTILETSLLRRRIPFRFSQHRLISVDYAGGIGDSDVKEVVLLKMHGSINWFDVSKYNNEAAYYQQGPFFQNPTHPIFSNHHDFLPEKIVSPNYFLDSPLNKVYYINDVRKYLDLCQYVLNAPLIISPSYAKMVYLNPLREFWTDFNGAGIMNPELIIIGFSFSPHDEYLRIPIVRAITNFQKHNRTDEIGYQSSNLKLIDFQASSQEIDKFKSQLPFIDWTKTNAFWDGLTKETIERVFNT
jgi:hypothetical protein